MATDPYKYFRVEARELVDGLAQGILELEKGASDPGVVARLLRLAHTLKGAARVVKALDLAELSHQLEEMIGPGAAAGERIDGGRARELLGLVDRMSACVLALAPPPAAAAAAVAPAPARIVAEEQVQTVRVEMDEMDALARALTETAVQVSGLKREVDNLRRFAGLAATLVAGLGARSPADGRGRTSREQGLLADLETGLERSAQALTAGLERVDQELADVREGADRLRLIPLSTLTAPLSRVVRDAAQGLSKQAEFELVGGDIRLAAHVLGPLRDALSHVVRNAVAHGIEAPRERAAGGKPAIGKVRLEVLRRGSRIVLGCHDDGRGIDIEAVRRELGARGVISKAEAAALSEATLLERLLSSKLTTASEVTQLAGRGVGLDVLRETIARLGGEVAIRTQAGQGTSVEMSVPISLAALRALLVDAGGATLAIPLDTVRETLRLDAADIRESAQGDTVAYGGKVIPFLPLARALRVAAARQSGAACSVVVIGIGERAAAVGVDRLRGTLDVVVKPLPFGVVADPVVAGAALDAEGNPQLVLDAAGLLDTAARDRGAVVETPRERRPILVIDDSLTTRMLEQSILESAGYEVELAVSAEQGLERARERKFGVFVVDVEMPGMDGFEFVARTRADPDLRVVPAILVTSRNADEDQARGRQVGASAYIVKGAFDQNLLLDTIRGLLLGGGT